MKNKTYKNILGFFLASLMFIASCKKEDPIKLDAQLETWEISNITSTTADVSGFVVAEGSGFSESGIVWATTEAPTIADNSALADKVEKAVYTAQATGLDHLTTYFVRAYSKSTDGTILYGEDETFETLAHLATVSVDDVTDITATTATSGGNVSYDGKADVTAKGLCWSMDPNPAIDSTDVTVTDEGEGTGVFTTDITGLIGGTTYYLRAYATNGIGTSYSDEVSFTTVNGLAVVTTESVTDITKTSAKLAGNALFTGGTDIAERGFYWGTSANPTVADNTIAAGSGLGKFEADLSGLDPGVTYYIRAYAINSNGTAYGEDVQFTTVADIWKFWVVGDYNGWDNSDAALYLLSTASSPEAEGYVNFTNTGGFKLTTDHSWTDPFTYGDDGAGALTNPGGNISVSAAGYYLIKADGVNMTYSLTETVWGIIGDFNGWGSQVDMAYDPTSMTFHLAQTFSSTGGFKFRGTPDWSINYGDKTGDGILDTENDNNIPISIVGDYAITMDLSNPDAYTYSANTWGIIGDFNSWGDDVNMTWDAVNSVFVANITVASDGGFKFRANDDWIVNYGDKDGDGNLDTENDNNISISTGDYKITLDPWSKVYTVTAI
ncbi:MAG: hypothetical protein ABFS35_17990 [Bacteroidota bacterium]